MEPPSLPQERVVTRAELLQFGYTPWRLRRAVAAGHITRLRRDRYVGVPDAAFDEAVRAGGRATCITLLAVLGVFVRSIDALHIHVGAHAARLSAARHVRATRVHWGRLVEDVPSRHAVSVFDAVRCAIRCQSPRDAIATIDSVIHLGLMTVHELPRLFETLPVRYGALLPLIDGRAESGIESLVRLMLRQLGADVEVQVQIATVGRVDLVVDGWLIVECDSKEFHEGWDKQRSDRRRDFAALRRGYVTIRLLAEDVLYDADAVRAALAEVLSHGRTRRG